jgi:hypothetical protein
MAASAETGRSQLGLFRQLQVDIDACIMSLPQGDKLRNVRLPVRALRALRSEAAVSDTLHQLKMVPGTELVSTCTQVMGHSHLVHFKLVGCE